MLYAYHLFPTPFNSNGTSALGTIVAQNLSAQYFSRSTRLGQNVNKLDMHTLYVSKHQKVWCGIQYWSKYSLPQGWELNMHTGYRTTLHLRLCDDSTWAIRMPLRFIAVTLGEFAYNTMLIWTGKCSWNHPSLTSRIKGVDGVWSRSIDYRITEHGPKSNFYGFQKSGSVSVKVSPLSA